MAKSTEKVFYAVGRGREVGIFDSWKECQERTEGVLNAKYRKFYSYKDAEEFVNFWKNYSSPEKKSRLSENLVSNIRRTGGCVVNGRQSAYEGISSVTDSTSCRPMKITGKQVLGGGTSTENHDKESTWSLLPYTSPLSARSFGFVRVNNNKTDKQLKVPAEHIKPKKSSKVKRFSYDDLRTLDNNCTSGFSPSNAQRRGFKKPKNCLQRAFSSVPSSLSSSLNNSASCCINKPFVTSAQESVPTNSTENENKSSEPHSGIPCTNDSDYQNDSSLSNGRISEISEKLTSCLKSLVSILEIVAKENINGEDKVKNFLETFLRQTNNDTNTDVNPQMEPQENVDMICEDTKNFELHPAGIRVAAVQEQTSLEPQSSVPYVALQSSLSQLPSTGGITNEKDANIIALNLRLESFERRFDACLKEIGGIVAELSHIKSDIRQIKETLNSDKKKQSSGSPEKAKDGKVQTTLCFDSATANNSARSYSSRESNAPSKGSGVTERRSLKRKLSRSSPFEDSERSAEDDVEDFLSRVKTEKVDYASFTVDDDDYVEVYTDGSAHSNGKEGTKAGIGIWFGDNHPLNVAEAVVGTPTNNTAEIQAARVAIQLATKAGITKLKIFTDSDFLINCATKWIHRWKNNGWTLRDGGPVKNRKELEKLLKASSKIRVRWEKVAAHSNITGNEAADRLANEGALKYK